MTGRELRAIRAKFGLTQREFSPLVGITQNALARLERGERKISETLSILAKLLAVKHRKPIRRKRK